LGETSADYADSADHNVTLPVTALHIMSRRPPVICAIRVIGGLLT
jgi:hypothetical protein